MSLFGNQTINRLNLHSTIQALAAGAGNLFILVYMLRAGVSAPLVLCAMAAMTATRFVLRPLVLPIARRIGLKRALIAGTVLDALSFVLLPLVHGPGAPFVAYILIGPVGSVLYWTCYHAYFAIVGDGENRGGQVGARQAMITIIGIVAPLIGATALALGGSWVAFLLAALIQISAALPLIGAPDVAIDDPAPGPSSAYRQGATLMVCDGIFAGGYHYVWTIALFVSLGESFTAYGGAMAMSALIGAAVSIWQGKYIDGGGGRSAIVIALAVAVTVTALRAASLGSPWLAVSANGLGALVEAVWIPAIMTPVYNLAKASPSALRFSMATEAGWDVGCGAACLVGAAIVAKGATFAAPILVGLGGAGMAFALLWKHYGGNLVRRSATFGDTT